MSGSSGEWESYSGYWVTRQVKPWRRKGEDNDDTSLIRSALSQEHVQDISHYMYQFKLE